MNVLTEGIIIAIVAAIAGSLAGWLQSRGNKEHLHAQAVKIYQDVALTETRERERLEERFEAKIAALNKKIKALEAERDERGRKIEDLNEKIQKLSSERDQWILDREHMEEERKKIAQDREEIALDRLKWSRERQSWIDKIAVLEEDIRKLKVKTGTLKN
jgi:uncharacterized protein HemX